MEAMFADTTILECSRGPVWQWIKKYTTPAKNGRGSFWFRFNPLLMIPICLVSGLMALAIAWSTVAGNTARAARENPIHSLRYE